MKGDWTNSGRAMTEVSLPFLVPFFFPFFANYNSKFDSLRKEKRLLLVQLKPCSVMILIRY